MKAVFQKASAAILTVVSLALPLAVSAETDQETGLRTEAWSAHRVVQTFVNVGGATSGSFDNDSLGDSGFDFAALFSHPCYGPVGEYLKESCSRRFGIYGDLKAAIATDGLRDALVAKFGSGILGLVGNAKADFAESKAEDAAQASEDSDVVSFYGDFRARRIQLWAICQERFEGNPAACYQDNLRLLGEKEISISGNVNHHGTAQ